MTAKIVLEHVCPRCRAPREGWTLEGVDGPKAGLYPGTAMPEGDLTGFAKDTCADCGYPMIGFPVLDDDRPDGGSQVWLVTVTEDAGAGELLRTKARAARLQRALVAKMSGL